MKKFIFCIFFVCLPIITSAQCYISCPDGALAFSSLEAYDKVFKACLINDRENFKKLLADNEIRILDPGVIVVIKEKTDLVAAVTIEGSSKLWAVPLKFISCKSDKQK